MKTSHVRVAKDCLRRTIDVICRRPKSDPSLFPIDPNDPRITMVDVAPLPAKRPSDLRPGDLIGFGHVYKPLVKFDIEATKSGRIPCGFAHGIDFTRPEMDGPTPDYFDDDRMDDFLEGRRR